MSTKAQVDAVLVVLNAAIAPSIAYPYDKVPAERPVRYVEVSISRRFGGERRASAQKGRIGWRLTVRAIADRVSDALLLHDQAQEALEGLFLSINDKATPVEFETEEPVGPDDRSFSGLTSYTYTS